ncbi:MAG: ABC transporter permease [Coriobacteriia bacterium]|nr:ABC transporter permease [Coriobacteriia bacterium]
MRRIWAIAQKEFIHIIRDPRLLMVIVAMPLIQMFLYSYALSFDVKNLPTATLDFDRTTQSRQYLDALQQSNYFKVNQTLGSYSEVDNAFMSNKDNVVVVVGSGFGDALAAGRAGNVQIIIDGSDANSAQLAQGYTAALSRVYGSKVVVTQVQAKGFSTASVPSLSGNTRVWYNPEGKSAAYFVPGLIVVLVTMVMVLQSANTLVKEKENGTYEQLIVSPVRKIELMVGKIAPWTLIGGLEIIIIASVGILGFNIPFRGSALLLALASLLYVACTLGMGLIISARASSVDTANQLAALVGFLPTFMLSGFIFPISSLPLALQLISYCFPGRYFMVITRTIFLKGGGLEVLWPQYLALTIFAVTIVTLAASMYRERT